MAHNPHMPLVAGYRGLQGPPCPAQQQQQQQQQKQQQQKQQRHTAAAIDSSNSRHQQQRVGEHLKTDTELLGVLATGVVSTTIASADIYTNT
jgi:hypothetical protein